MSSVNKVILIGHLGADPELRDGRGQPVCNLRIATSESWNDKDGQKQERTEWHRVTVWGKQAEHCKKFLEKGRQVYVEGRLQTSSYEQDGIKKYSTEVVAQTVQFLGGKGGGGGASGGGGGGGGGGSDQPSGDSNQTPIPGGDDVPF